MTKREVIDRTVIYVKGKMSKDSSGHDWWHVHRVWKNAIKIGRSEKADLFVVQLVALLHDIEDWKFGNNTSSTNLAESWLKKMMVDDDIILHVCQIIRDASFKGSRVIEKMKTIEGKVFQDADRLDAIGAIGIARVFTTGTARGRALFDPTVSLRKRVVDFRNGKDSHSSIHHFYDKVLILKDLMYTETAKEIAKQRHAVMENFLDEFFKEWNGKS
jgi:uncharacterized protein